MVLCAKTSGCAFASSTVSGSSGQPGLTVAYPASSKTVIQRSQLLGSSQSPWMNTTGWRPEALARSICSSTYGGAVEMDIVSSNRFTVAPSRTVFALVCRFLASTQVACDALIGQPARRRLIRHLRLLGDTDAGQIAWSLARCLGGLLDQ